MERGDERTVEEAFVGVGRTRATSSASSRGVGHRGSRSTGTMEWSGTSSVGQISRANSARSLAEKEGRRGKRVSGPRAAPKKPWYKLSLRSKKVGFFVASELVLLALVAMTLVLLENALLEVYQDSAKSQVGLVDVTYELKMNQMGLGFFGNSLNGYLKSFLELDAVEQADTSSLLYGRVFNVLESELGSRQIEFSLLLNTSGYIVATGNAERQGLFADSHTGRFFNPGNLTHRVLSMRDTVGYQTKSSVVLPRSEIFEERPPTWRERPQAFLPSGDYHWTDVDHDCLVRFTLTSIHSDAGNFLGIIVSGDVLNGKIPVAYNVVDVLDRQAGFVGVYNEDHLAGWVKASLYYRSFADSKAGSGFVLDSATSNPVTSGFLSRAAGAARGELVTDRQPGFVLAARPVPAGTEQLSQTSPVMRIESDVPRAVIVRGIDLKAHTTFEDVLELTMITVGIVVFLDLVVVLLALQYLIKPLEQMAFALRNGVRLEEADIRKLQVGPFWAVLIIISALPAVICIILVIVSNNEAINTAMRDTAEAQVGAGIIAFKTKIDQMSFGFVGAANQEAVHAALLNSTDPTALNAARDIMDAEINKRQIEFATVVDMSGTVLVSPNADRVGQHFDPYGIVEATRVTQQRQKWTASLTFAEFEEENPPVWQERLSDDTPRSLLYPARTRKSTIVRYTTTPVDANADGIPDGVLVSGDIVGGKTTIVETILNVNDEGFEAVYMQDEDDFWILCASAFKYEAGDEVRVDEELPYYGLLDDALSAGKAVSRFGTVRGKSYVFAASPLTYSVTVTPDGEELPVPQLTKIVIVHGNPTTDGDAIKREQTIISIFILVVQILTSGFMIWIAFDPVRKMIGVMKSYGFASEQSSWLFKITTCDWSSMKNSKANVAGDYDDDDLDARPSDSTTRDVQAHSGFYSNFLKRMAPRSRRTTEVIDSEPVDQEQSEISGCGVVNTDHMSRSRTPSPPGLPPAPSLAGLTPRPGENHA